MTALMPPLVGGVTTTTGSSSFTITGPIPTPTTGNYREWSTLANGSYYVIRWDTGGSNYERGVADLVVSGGVATLTWNPREDTSTGGAAPVLWAGGTQNVWTTGAPFIPSNGGLEVQPYAADWRTSLGLTSAATTPIGTAAGQLIAWAAGPKYPEGDGSLFTNLPAGTPSIPSGTVLGGFYQSSAPSGWARHATLDDKVIRIVKSGSLVGIAGTDNGATWSVTGLSASSHTLTLSEIPAHTHDVACSLPSGSSTAVLGTTTGGLGPIVSGAAVGAGGGGGHTHAVSSDGTWRPPSYDCLAATKS